MGHAAETLGSVRTRDMRFAYTRVGQGTPILLLHGWPQTSFAWRKIMPLLCNEHDVIAPDLPGFGYSSKPDSGFDKKTVSARLREFVQSLGLSRIAIAGHDLGGHVAFAYAAQWPDEVSHLVFIESSLPAFGQEAGMDVARGGSWHFGFNMAGDISEELVRGREFLFVDHFMRREKVGLFDANAVGSSEIEHYAQALARPGALRSSFSYYRTIPIDREDNRAWGQTPLQMPVLAVGADWGYGDASSRTIRQVASNVEDVLIERCGHYPPEERPHELAAAIKQFLGRSRTAGG
ncbi:alpha/beta fold hydrolase [Bosea robiniae]|uniref:Pimeloyl-ACP methyl ester carboxylesterase n=1 Tax=Bosea robiniae TaxID=1036780 RepID=A0ABY0P3K1_9HYPH|nr:alpha/beta fold hydrolase [Bosea robiniae]SDH14278.1 Pimeloyl-ACP methyl ester carboxylesterase [Bosea robiniae]